MTTKTDHVQFGLSVTPANNFTLTTDGLGGAKLARGNAGAPTQDILTVDSAGRASFPQGGPTLKTSASAPYTPAAGELLSRPHGLGFVPSSARIILECVVADVGYSIGDRVAPVGQWTGSVAVMVLPYVDATNCAVKCVAGYLVYVTNKTTGAIVSPTANAWKYYFEVTA